MSNQKKQTKRKKSNQASTTKHKIGRILKRILLYLVIICLLFTFFLVIKVGKTSLEYQKQAKEAIQTGGTAIFSANQTSIIYDCNGEKITELVGVKDSYYLEFDEIPYFVKRALITTEDRSFYEHSGVDPKGILRAFVELVKNDGKITQGGSTITQQLARNIYLSHEVTMSRKLKEMFLAMELEKQFEKDEILEYYINNIYFGNGYYGIEAAAKGYFGKSVPELSIGEMAYICAIPNNPSLYDPYLHNENTVERKNRILKQMLEQQDIDQELYDEALYETIVLVPTEHQKNNYVETYAKYCATIALMAHSGFEFRYTFTDTADKEAYEEAYYQLYDEFSAKLFTGGYRIYTTLDLEKQEWLQQAVDEVLLGYTETYNEGIFSFQGAATCINNETGKVVAIVGGRRQLEFGYTLNRAYQSYRQPGSTIKPILTYVPMFARGYTPDSIVSDTKIPDGPVNSPNYYEGNITLRRAVETSKNTIAWKLYEELTPYTALSHLTAMNFKKIVQEDHVQAASIGGLTYGVSTVEMASAYSTIENDGEFRSPTCINKITDADYNTIIDNIDYRNAESSTVEIKKIYDTNSSRTMTDVLKGVLTNGTGKKFQAQNGIYAAKTGTTNGNKDCWLVGYSSYYTTAVWCGYDMPREISDGYGDKTSGYIWQKFMTKIHENLELLEFPPCVQEEKETETTSVEESSTESNLYTEDESTVELEEEITVPIETEFISEIETETTREQQTTSRRWEEKRTTKKQPRPTGNATSGELYTEYWGE
jgi:membrane peptidoglycan carboxypeptidase